MYAHNLDRLRYKMMAAFFNRLLLDRLLTILVDCILLIQCCLVGEF